MKEYALDRRDEIRVDAGNFSGYREDRNAMFAHHRGNGWGFRISGRTVLGASGEYTATPLDIQHALLGDHDHWVTLMHRDIITERGSAAKLFTTVLVCGGLWTRSEWIKRTLNSVREAIDSGLLQQLPEEASEEFDRQYTLFTSPMLPGYAFAPYMSDELLEMWRVVDFKNSRYVDFVVS